MFKTFRVFYCAVTASGYEVNITQFVNAVNVPSAITTVRRESEGCGLSRVIIYAVHESKKVNK